MLQNKTNLNFEYAIEITPLGMLYGSAGAFLSPENLVGRSGAKFPPDAATVAGLITYQTKPKKHKCTLQVAGPFWSSDNDVYVPIPWNYIIGHKYKTSDCWGIESSKNAKGQSIYRWRRMLKDDNSSIKPEKTWQNIEYWNPSQDPQKAVKLIEGASKNPPWRYNAMLHPSLKDEQRHVKDEDGLFLENSVQMDEETRLFYISTEEIPSGWYRFGGENHIVEVQCSHLKDRSPMFYELLHEEQHKVGRSFALITPGVWGSNRLSHRYPQTWEFGEPVAMLTDKPVPWRNRLGHRLQRGRYAVPAGSVYVLDRPINKLWRDWCNDWFPKHGLPLKKFGCGLALPIYIPGLEN